MDKVLRAFGRGLRETPRAFFAPLFSALESVRRVFEDDASPQHKERRKHAAPN